MKKNLFFIFFLFYFGSLFAQQDTLLLKYRKMSVDYQQKVKMAQSRLKGAEFSAEAANSDYLPKFDFSGSYNYYGVPLQLAPTQENSVGEEIHNRYSLDLTLTQPLWTGGFLSAKRGSAISQVEMMKNYVNLNRQEVMLNADLLYWEAIAKKEIHNILLVYRNAIGEFLKVIQDRVNEEVVGKNELFQIKVRYNDAEFEAIQTEKDYNISLMALKRYLGLPLDSAITVPDTLDIINWDVKTDDPESIALQKRPEIGLLQNNISVNQFNEDITASKYNPQIGFLIGGKYGYPSPGLKLEPDFNYYLKAYVSVPIFYWGMKTYDVSSKEQETEISKLKFEETKDKISLEINQIHFKLRKTQEQLNFASGSLENASKNVSVMLDRYNEGLSSVLEVLDAQLYWQKTYFNYVNAKYQLNVAYSQYLRAMGVISY